MAVTAMLNDPPQANWSAALRDPHVSRWDFGCGTRSSPGDGVITGSGTINGRLVFVFS